MSKVRYQEMLPHEIVERRAHFPVAYLPVGTIEWHGEHAAVGLDGLKAERLCELAAEDTGGFAFPTLWYGEPRAVEHMDAAEQDTPEIRRALRLPPPAAGEPEAEIIRFQTLLRSVIGQLYDCGMKVACVLCGHYPLYDWAEPVAKALNGELVGTSAIVGTEVHYAGDPEVAGGDHAGVWETSYLWYLRPDCVDLSVYDGREATTRLIGIEGEDPRRGASPQLGAGAVARIVAGIGIAARNALAACG